MAKLDEVTDGKIDVIGPDFAQVPAQGSMDMAILIKVAGRQMQQDFEPVLERQIHYFVNGASGIQHVGQRDIAWIRISNAAADKGFSLESFGKFCTPASMKTSAQLWIKSRSQLSLSQSYMRNGSKRHASHTTSAINVSPI
jgi:CO dehydrogenase/acetyl-CoA synthase beta subunit